MTVENMKNTNGNSIKNQFIIDDPATGVTTFQSYDSKICEVIYKHTLGFDKIVKIYPNWNYSKTTSKYFYKFLSEYCYIPIKNKQDVEDAFQRGYCRLDEGIAVIKEY